MDIVYVYEKLAKILVRIWGSTFVFAGIELTIGAVILWSALAGVVIWFLRGLAE